MTLQKHRQVDFPPAEAQISAAPAVILMAVYNGADCLGEQLTSFAAQDHENWHLLASDDGSTDGSPALLQGFANAHRGQVSCLEGPGQGLARNFLFLIEEAARRGMKDRWTAFSDQDDIWLPDRLSRGIAALSVLPKDRPALYCSRRYIWDPATDRRQLSRAYPHAGAFANALVENIAPGNTIVLNPAAAALAVQAAPHARDIYAHDWWLYLLITGAGGQVIWDVEPSLLYRQHADNQVGAGERPWRAATNKLTALRGAFADRIERNIAALGPVAHMLTSEAQTCLETFAAARRATFLARVRGMGRAGVWRQGWLAHLILWAGVCLGRV